MSDWAALSKAALRRGDLIAAYDATVSAIEEGDESGTIRHQQVLALARMGDTERAMEAFEAYALDRSQDVDERSIGARLLKDRALAAPAGDRLFALERAFDAYHGIYQDSRNYFPGINAATLALFAGRDEEARALAAAVLADAEVAAARDYFPAVTKAEALLILGRTDAVTQALLSDPVSRCKDVGSLSSSFRQLAMVAVHLGLDEAARAALLAPLALPRVVHFCGHMFAADAEAEARIKAEAGAIFEEENIGFAFGALACGSDLILAEAALERGVELNVVLPFDEDDFLAQSVLPGGPDWEGRYRDAIARANDVHFASEMEYFGDPAQYGYSSRMAMGLARLRAEHLATEPIQLAVWDGKASVGPAGTGADVAIWAEQGQRSRIIDPGPVDRRLVRPEPRVDCKYDRTLAAILFTDFKGFSMLKESKLPIFWEDVMGAVANVLDAHRDEIECRNSWGDALYAVANSAPGVAQIALELQDHLSLLDFSKLGLDETVGMRIGAHYGPAYRTMDHITGRTTFYGTEVSKAARIEPVTPPGAVFVTEPLAAILALEASDRFACRYVGRIPLAKKYGDYPMYRLTRAS